MNSISVIYMRSGTSKGPFLDLRELPIDTQQRDQVLLQIMGSPDPKQIDGIGGSTFVTSKVVMVKPSNREGVDVDYLFAQVIIDKPIVDTRPTCGNMMAGVGPFAIEKGWVNPKSPQTPVMVYNLNTKSIIEIIVQTPHGEVNYQDGDFKIDGVPGTGAPIVMNAFEIAGGATGKLFPIGSRKNIIQGIDISVVDAGNLLLLMKANSFGLTGEEDADFFRTHVELMEQIEKIRLEVGTKIGLGDVSESVLPKIALLSEARQGGHIKSQYFTPKTLHPSHAVSGATCIATALLAKGTVAHDIAPISANQITLEVEHPSGCIPIEMNVEESNNDFRILKTGSIRTARKIMEGNLFY